MQCLRTSDFADDVIFSRNGAESIRRRCVWLSSLGGGPSRRQRRAALLVTGAKSAILDCLVGDAGDGSVRTIPSHSTSSKRDRFARKRPQS